MTMDEDQAALVTGAGNGLGRAIAHRLSKRYNTVILVGRDREKLADTADLLPPGVGRVEVADVSDESAVRGLADACSDLHVSLLVNNAGVAGPVAPLTDIDVGDWDAVFASNVRSVFLMCRAFIPGMVAAGSGHVINIASVSGKRPLPRRTPYTASKMAILGLTRTLAFEVGPAGVRVNSLSPGPVAGPRMARNFELEATATGTSVGEAERSFVSRAALGRMVEESEVADAVMAMLAMPGLCGADVDLSAGMVAPS